MKSDLNAITGILNANAVILNSIQDRPLPRHRLMYRTAAVPWVLAIGIAM
jgi:hypothetical protein